MCNLRNDLPRMNNCSDSPRALKWRRLPSTGVASFGRAVSRSVVAWIHIIDYTFVEGVFVTMPAPVPDVLVAHDRRVAAHSGEAVMNISAPVFRVTTRCLTGDVERLRGRRSFSMVGMIPSQDRMLLTVRDAEGKERSLTVVGEPKGPMAGVSLLRPDSWTAPDLDAAARRDLLV